MIYLVRYGQTEFNLAGRHHGWSDSPLTQLGRAQAGRAGQVLAKLVHSEDAAMFASPLGRAVETASIISRTIGVRAPTTVDCDLREIGMGSAEGLTEAELACLRTDSQPRAPQGRMSLQAPDGETLATLGERLTRALKRITGDPARAKIVVSHGVAGRVLRAIYLGRSPEAAAGFAAPHDAMFRLDAGRVLRLDLGKD